MKMDQTGNILWTKTLGGSEYNEGNSVEQTSDGGFIVAGSIASISSSDHDDIYLIKTDSEGTPLWSKNYSGVYINHGFSVKETSDNCFIICGVAFNTSGADNILLIKTDPNG